jgi:hypothetical protein|tara:strand:- start:659 stop:1009 length:351 start_codon:yes stop_codon:yes gene_type:complete
MSKDFTWLANYHFRNKILSTKALRNLGVLDIQPKYKEREVERYTLKQYIEFLGMPEAAEKFECSIASIKSWRYGYRQPSVDQAKKIIKASNGRLDFESIYGNLEDIVAESVQSKSN